MKIVINLYLSENHHLKPVDFQELKEKLDTDEQNMVDNNKINGFCGIVNGECKNIYDTENGYLTYTGNVGKRDFIDIGKVMES